MVGHCPRCNAWMQQAPHTYLGVEAYWCTNCRHCIVRYQVTGLEGIDDVDPDTHWWHQQPIEELHLSVRACIRLQAAGIQTVGELVKFTEQQLLRIDGFGERSLDNVICGLHDEASLALAQHGQEKEDYWIRQGRFIAEGERLCDALIAFAPRLEQFAQTLISNKKEKDQ